SVFSRLELDDDLRLSLSAIAWEVPAGIASFSRTCRACPRGFRGRRHHLPRDGASTRHPSRAVWRADWLRAPEAHIRDQYIARGFGRLSFSAGSHFYRIRFG